MRALALLVLLVLLTRPIAAASAAETMVEVPTSRGQEAVRFHAAAIKGKHPAVIILHGLERLDAGDLPFFRRYADALAQAGIDAYIPSYYSAADAEAMASPDRPARVAYFGTHVQGWAKFVSQVADFALRSADSSGRVGLLGFSNGGFLAVAAAQLDPRFSALVVFYGGIPDFLLGKVTHLPPLLELHGGADRTILLSRGTKIAEAARALGVPAQQIVYPGVGHGFDDDAKTAVAKAALKRTLAFFKERLAVP